MYVCISFVWYYLSRCKCVYSMSIEFYKNYQEIVTRWIRKHTNKRSISLINDFTGLKMVCLSMQSFSLGQIKMSGQRDLLPGKKYSTVDWMAFVYMQIIQENSDWWKPILFCSMSTFNQRRNSTKWKEEKQNKTKIIQASSLVLSRTQSCFYYNSNSIFSKIYVYNTKFDHKLQTIKKNEKIIVLTWE